LKISRMRQSLIPILLSLLLLSILWTYLSINMEPAAEPEEDMILTVLPDYRVISGRDLMAWPKGTVFEQGMAAYFYAADPTVAVTPIIEVTGLQLGKLEGTIESEIYIRALNDKSQVYWSYLLRNTPEQTFVLSPGVSFHANELTLDVPSAYASVMQISDELMFQNGLFQLLVSFNIHVNGTANHIPIDKTIQLSLPVSLQDVSFTLPQPQEISSQVSFGEDHSSPSLYQSLSDTIRQNLVPFILDAILILSILILRNVNQMSKSKAAKEHKRFKEWITEGSVEIKDRFSISILSLEGLVDLAIDLDKRVIYDPGIRKYYVLTEDIVYIYDYERSHALLENREQLGKLLLKRGLLQPEQLEIGLYYQKRTGSKLGKSLIALGFIDETTLYSTLAAQQGIDYYELNPKTDDINLALLKEIGIQRARALMAVPLGERADHKLVVACSEAARNGMLKTLQELFKTEIFLVATRPSLIYEALEKAAAKENAKTGFSSVLPDKAPFERLTKKEQEQFTSSYIRGKIEHALLLKASGLIPLDMINQVPEQENYVSWLVSKNMLNNETVNLMKGMDKAVEALEWNLRKEKQLPGLLDLLLYSNHLTSDTKEWVNRELVLEEIPLEQLLLKNYLASENTLKYAVLLIHTLESLLYKTE
jgi:hypothetical protein